MYKKRDKLLEENRQLLLENEQLQNQIDDLDEYIGEQECTISELNTKINHLQEARETNSIHNLQYFIDKLKSDGLFTPELENFLEYYLKYYN